MSNNQDFKHLDQFSNHPYNHLNVNPNFKNGIDSLLDIPYSEIIKTRSDHVKFTWVNIGDKIGVKFNKQFSEHFINNAKNRLPELEETLKEINSTIKKLNEYKKIYPDITDVLDEKIKTYKGHKVTYEGFINYFRKNIEILSKDFYQVATIPKEIYENKLERNDTRVTLTVSISDKDGNNKLPNQLIKFIKRTSLNHPVHLVIIKETKKQKPAFRAYYSDFSNSSTGGITNIDRFIEGEKLEVKLDRNTSLEDSINSFSHEMMHVYGFFHPWEDNYKQMTLNPVSKNIVDFFKMSFKLGSLDHMNAAYHNFARVIFNKSFRSISRALLEAQYGSRPSHLKDVVFRFKPEKNKLDYSFNSYDEGNRTVEEYSGNVSGLTVHNNATASIFDFNFIQKFHAKPFLYSNVFNGSYADGVTTVLLDGGKSVIFKATFDTYQSFHYLINRVLYEKSRDNNVDTSLSTKYVKEVFYSPHSDKGYFESEREITLHPGEGNDEYIFAKGKKYIIRTNPEEGMDTLDFKENTGGVVHLGYAGDQLKKVIEGNDLLYFAEKQTSKGVERHGVRVPNYLSLKSQGKLSLQIKDSLGQSLN